ncbi:DUF2238 domain-containing protein [Geobacillus zalihae]|nr:MULTISPECIES: DUF2238 domain-containing protein [Geobacillus]EPR27522.1 putative membrane spanning protein [Geobacillus sp. WSUCF1]WKA49013.1 DUF2238 domain-containing protein [Geobacillus zalihae]
MFPYPRGTNATFPVASYRRFHSPSPLLPITAETPTFSSSARKNDLYKISVFPNNDHRRISLFQGGKASKDFLGTQGDIWDTQWDMVCTLIGTLIALWLLSRWHDRQLAQLNER